LVDLVTGRHDDENIHIAIGVRDAIGMGAEQDDLVGMKLFRHLPGKTANDAQGHVSPAIPARRRRCPRGALGSSHKGIVSATGAAEAAQL
jgi:hypothetical protein